MGNLHVYRASELDVAMKLLYERLAESFMKLIDIDRVHVALEAGCGNGELTVPLAKRVRRNCVVIAYDFRSGPYVEGVDVLKDVVANEGLKGIEVMKGDARNIGIADDSVNLIFSNEFFCDLDSGGLRRVLKEFYRILEVGGQMVHGELDPVPENRAQELLIKADLCYSSEPLPFKGEKWFSPTTQELSTAIRKAGFTNINVGYIKTNLKLSYNAAVEQLKKWKIDTAFVKEYENDLRKYGIEFPPHHLIKCEKKANCS